ncbi:MAG TPA: methionine--tRNA ligase [Bryobacteraceae bacterium]|nr:methionine--tRNA ligase [Bryobacteraceae bacterium]
MKYYLTTPLYYVNAAPHIGHTYTTLAAETIKRFKRMQGYTVDLTTGTDEHGQKVERSAQAAGKSPEEFTTIVSNEFRAQWDSLGIQYDHFIRTTDPRHYETVRWLFERCKANGYVYKGSYTGQYCVFDELYVNDAQPGDNCPDCGRPTETVTEENYFFKLSAFADKLLKHYEENPDFIAPESRRNEVISFVRGGLQDLSISRTSLKWGVPLEGKHVAYVWFDALIGYISAVKGTDLWPADLHLIGKEILRFHAVFWPAFLMAGDVPLPKRVFAHGWLLFENDKMSKSRGNIVRAEPIRQVMGLEALRYFLFREVVFGQDGSFSFDALVGRYNSELANGLGNLASRTLTMIKQYRDGVIPGASPNLQPGHPLAMAVRNTIEIITRSFDDFEFSRGLEAVWVMLSAVDKFIVEQAPWKLAKSTDPAAPQQLDDALYASAETLRIAVALLHPVLPESTVNIWAQLGMSQPLADLRIADLAWGQLPTGQKIGMIAPVFPRIEAASAIERMRALEEAETARQAKLLGKPVAAAEREPEGAIQPPSPKIDIEDFGKVDLRVGKVLSAERVKGADKLLHLKVDIGEPDPRTIVAGIATVYEPEKIVGRKVVIAANLHPRKLRGIESNGMIVAASLEGGKPILAGFLEDVPIGARLK